MGKNEEQKEKRRAENNNILERTLQQKQKLQQKQIEMLQRQIDAYENASTTLRDYEAHKKSCNGGSSSGSNSNGIPDSESGESISAVVQVLPEKSRDWSSGDKSGTGRMTENI